MSLKGRVGRLQRQSGAVRCPQCGCAFRPDGSAAGDTVRIFLPLRDGLADRYLTDAERDTLAALGEAAMRRAREAGEQ